MIVNEIELKKLLLLRPSGNKGWFTSMSPCPFCGKKGKLGIIFGKQTSSFHCYSGKCGKEGSIYLVLEKLGRTDLIQGYKPVDLTKKLENRLTGEDEIELDVKTCKMPMGFKRVYSNPYMEGRGFTAKKFEKYLVGETKIDPKLKKDYIIFGVIEGGEVKGYLGRNTKYDKKELENENKRRELLGLKPIMRYLNSSSPFEKLVFGLDEITEETKEIIGVEGITDKFNIEDFVDKSTVIIATFGKNLSIFQILKIMRNGPNIENFILMRDPDALAKMKEESFKVEHYLPTKAIRLIDKDPGELSREEFNELYKKQYDPLELKLDIL